MPKRLLFIDNLHWSMIILVLSMHASDTYSPFGNWYYTDRRPLSVGERVFFATYQSFLQGFFMALLFFIAAYFSRASYDLLRTLSHLRLFARAHRPPRARTTVHCPIKSITRLEPRIRPCDGHRVLCSARFHPKYFNAQGPGARFLSANAFAVYMFHPPILIACAILLHGVALPGLWKAALLTLLAATVTFSLAALVFRKIPYLRTVL